MHVEKTAEELGIIPSESLQDTAYDVREYARQHTATRAQLMSLFGLGAEAVNRSTYLYVNNRARLVLTSKPQHDTYPSDEAHPIGYAWKITADAPELAYGNAPFDV